ncbi:MAG: Uma2 family endonuclease [Candidatus Methylomirabilales bacterium]
MNSRTPLSQRQEKAAEKSATGGQRPREVPKGKLTYEEFLAWCDEDTWAEWVEGEVVMVSPASNRHQDLASFLTTVLRVFTEVHHLGMIRPAPFQMKTGAELPGREPDLLFSGCSRPRPEPKAGRGSRAQRCSSKGTG